MPVLDDVIVWWFYFMWYGKKEAITEYTMRSDAIMVNIVNIIRHDRHAFLSSIILFIQINELK